MKKSTVLLLIVFVFVFSGCADSANIEQCVEDSPYGFWGGLWHGMIVPFTWIGSLFMDNVAIYAVNNNGGWYDFGFVLGIGGLSFGGGKASK